MAVDTLNFEGKTWILILLFLKRSWLWTLLILKRIHRSGHWILSDQLGCSKEIDCLVRNCILYDKCYLPFGPCHNWAYCETVD